VVYLSRLLNVPARENGNIKMRAKEVTQKKPKVKSYLVKVKVSSGEYINIVDTIVYAVNPQMARKLARVQYDSQSVIVGQPREVKLR